MYSKEYEVRAGREIGLTIFIKGISSVIMLVIIKLSLMGFYSKMWILPLITLSSLIYCPLQDAIFMSTNYGKIFSAVNRVLLFLEEDENISNNSAKKDYINKKAVKSFKFNDASFAYDNKNLV